MLKQKKYISGIFVLIVLGAMFLFWKNSFAEDELEDEKDDEGPVQVINTNPANKKAVKTETVTATKKLSDTVTEATTTVTRHDSDGDGLYDDEDPHPTINEYFIVKDDNLNGIDDRYEI